MLSRIGRSVCRSSRTTPLKNAVFSGHGLHSTKICSENVFENGGLGLLRSYVSSIGAGKQVLKSNVLKEFRNPSPRRFFTSQAPKANNGSGAGEVSELRRMATPEVYLEIKRRMKNISVVAYSSCAVVYWIMYTIEQWMENKLKEMRHLVMIARGGGYACGGGGGDGEGDEKY